MVRSAFDDDMSGQLRQSMPLPPVLQIAQTEAWTELRRFIQDLISLEDLRETPEPAYWTVSSTSARYLTDSSASVLVRGLEDLYQSAVPYIRCIPSGRPY